MLPKPKTTMNTIEPNACSKFFEENSTPTKDQNQISSVWTKETFDKSAKHEISLNKTTMSWQDFNDSKEPVASEAKGPEDVEMEVRFEEETNEAMQTQTTQAVESEVRSPAHHARRPMNAFLIFCKKHRPIVRKKFQSLENRGVTRILGEWWAMLDSDDKDPYRDLAKEYKDAFFCANPDFKWYKLPAPPLRTLTTRPSSVQPEPSFPQSPTLSSNQHESEFTPGKLADESQLGNLTSLMQSAYGKAPDSDATKPPNTPPSPSSPTPDVPAKPLKKRKIEEAKTIENKGVARKIFDTDDEKFTNRDLVDKVVENMFIENQNTVPQDVNNSPAKEPRKSERSCKGLKYIEFMANGKLLKNKREKNANQNSGNSELAVNQKKEEERVEKLDLQETIRRLAERTNKPIPDFQNNNNREKSGEENCTRNEFNLDYRISILPTLNYDAYMQKKRDSKKRKLPKSKNSANLKQRAQTTSSAVNNNNNNSILIGSQKRKNKQSITHLELKDNNNDYDPTDLSGLTTLAEIAANSQKIN